MSELLYVISGGALGSALRFYVYKFVQPLSVGGFPFSTLVVNVIGSLLFGLFLNQIRSHSHFALFFAVGLLGSFTTFSTFSFESVQLLKEDKLDLFLFSVLANLIIGFGGFYIGVLINQKAEIF